jgi:hypothetical protein
MNAYSLLAVLLYFACPDFRIRISNALIYDSLNLFLVNPKIPDYGGTVKGLLRKNTKGAGIGYTISV